MAVLYSYTAVLQMVCKKTYVNYMPTICYFALIRRLGMWHVVQYLLLAELNVQTANAAAAALFSLAAADLSETIDTNIDRWWCDT